MRGVALVVDDVRKGPRLAFAYPPRPADAGAEAYFARLLRPKAPLCGRVLHLSVDGLFFVGFPIALPRADAEHAPQSDGGAATTTAYAWGDELDVCAAAPAAGAAAAASDPLSLFNVVFIAAPGDAGGAAAAGGPRDSGAADGDDDGALADGGPAAATAALLAALAIAAQRVATCLLYEERRCGYVTREVHAMLGGGDSRLRTELTAVFDGLLRAGACHVAVNGLLSLSLSLSLDAAQSADVDDGGGGTVLLAPPPRPAARAPIRHYHTLLLLRAREDVLALLPPDSSPQLAALVRAASPLRSFHELQGETGIPQSQLLRLAAHLVRWRLGRISDVVTSHSVFVVSERVSPADLAPHSALSQAFARAFGDAGRGRGGGGGGGEGTTGGGGNDDAGAHLSSLADVLALFSHLNYDEAPPASVGGSAAPPPPSPAAGGPGSGGAPRALPSGKGFTLHQLMHSMPDAAGRRFMDALGWLLTAGLLARLHTHVYLLWPPSESLLPRVPSHAGHDEPSSARAQLSTEGGGGEAAPRWTPADEAVLAAVDAAAAADGAAPDTETAALMRRVAWYLREKMAAFDGGHAPTDAVALHPALQLALRVEDLMSKLRVKREALRAVLRAYPRLFVTSTHA